jgi:hypothetical protein
MQRVDASLALMNAASGRKTFCHLIHGRITLQNNGAASDRARKLSQRIDRNQKLCFGQ